jgi:hypothetical protein
MATAACRMKKFNKIYVNSNMLCDLFILKLLNEFEMQISPCQCIHQVPETGQVGSTIT